jgi:hypothetical protein
MEFRHYQKKVIACIACEHGVPTRSMSFIPQKDGYVVLPTSARRRIRIVDHVVRFNTSRLASKLTRALRV